MIEPREGTVKPERLKYFEQEVYSKELTRRIDWSTPYMKAIKKLIYDLAVGVMNKRELYFQSSLTPLVRFGSCN